LLKLDMQNDVDCLLAMEDFVDRVGFIMLGAGYYKDDFKSLTGYSASRAKTLLSWFEAVFRKYYDNLKDLKFDKPISEDYCLAWDLFAEAVKNAVRRKQNINAICPVMYIKLSFDSLGKLCVIDDVGIRPCAIGHGFVQVILGSIANVLLDASDVGGLKIESIGLRYWFVRQVVEEIESIIRGKIITRTTSTERSEKTTHIGKDGMHVISYYFIGENLELLRQQQIMNGWNPPSVGDINYLTSTKPFRKKLIQDMLSDKDISIYFRSMTLYLKPNDDVDFPSSLDIDTTGLKIYKPTGMVDPEVQTLLSWFEAVFRKYYDHLLNLETSIDIVVEYGAAWDHFFRSVGDALQGRCSFNGICPVLYMNMSFNGDVVVINNVNIRPCAIGYDFFESILKLIADTPGVNGLEIKTIDMRRWFVEQFLNDIHPVLRFQETVVQRANIDECTFKFEAENFDSLKRLKILDRSTLPSASDINNLALKKEKRISIIRNMLDKIPSVFKTVLYLKSNEGISFPPLMDVYTFDLKVYSEIGVQDYKP